MAQKLDEWNLLPIIARAKLEYQITGPPVKSWSLKFFILFSILKADHYKLEKISSLQYLTQKADNKNESKTNFKKQYCSRNKLAVAYMEAESNYFHENAREGGQIYGEFLSTDKSTSDKVVYMLHGGAYIFGSPQFERGIAYLISKCTNIQTYAIAYRLAPKNEYPCAVIDYISGYIHLLDSFEPKNIFFVGSSAGGGLALSTLLAIKGMGLPLPGGANLISPWVDLTQSFLSFIANDNTDYLPRSMNLKPSINRKQAYSPDDQLKSKYVSPIYAESLSGLDLPIQIQVGGVERLFDEDVELAKRIRLENPQFGSRLEIYEDQVHVFHAFTFLPSSRVAFGRIGSFFKDCIAGQTFRSEVVEFNPDGIEKYTPKL
jgi:acetyl esterase/lipase